jgi:hypothetical protein
MHWLSEQQAYHHHLRSSSKLAVVIVVVSCTQTPERARPKAHQPVAPSSPSARGFGMGGLGMGRGKPTQPADARGEPLEGFLLLQNVCCLYQQMSSRCV